jgi:hypothetical protein
MFSCVRKFHTLEKFVTWLLEKNSDLKTMVGHELMPALDGLPNPASKFLGINLDLFEAN